jgi:hypothetical protein
MSSDDERPAPHLKQGGGRGRTGGFGYVYNQEFAQPFENALKVTMNTYKLPASSVFNAAVTTQILSKLKTTFANLSRPVHERLQKEENAQTMSWNGVSDTIRRFVFGIYDRDKIPVYIVQAVQEIEHPKWKAFFTQRLIVKHNHRTVLRCIESHRAPDAIPELLDLEGHVLPPDVPHQPKPSEFFDTITVPHEDIPGQQVLAAAPVQDLVEAALPAAAAEEPAPDAAAPAPRQVREVGHA